ncbi:helix-turn-helix domain-containing protein [Lentzea flava]|uniref:Transcriptional regulator n=1 Tax=Lentzea flava TaxID=103732 RepID=A0ABQ2UE38_9PSEU|nr:AraC family transcriptional regulator [Lentzea flava]MCP2198420.1 AraC-type DNA-binding protein [Lentzea flava]GGU25792.1 transcriptional regulator [Lentzea flava]
MVKNRQSAAAILEVEFQAPIGSPSGVQVLTLGELRSRNLAMLARLQRLHFHQLITPAKGRLGFMVDFVDYTAEPGSWLWVRPGEVGRWGDLTDVEGSLILFEDDFLDPDTAETARINEPGAPTLYTPENGGESLRMARTHLEHEFRALGTLPLPVHLSAMRHLLAVLAIRLSHTGTTRSPAGEANETFRRFRHAVERDFARTRRVEDYAAQLGYSPRTLARAAFAATGMGAKEFIDRRIILEAKRLLAHSDHTAAKIANDLGFNDATNFSKYFHQRTRQTPIAFRTKVRQR